MSIQNNSSYSRSMATHSYCFEKIRASLDHVIVMPVTSCDLYKNTDYEHTVK